MLAQILMENKSDGDAVQIPHVSTNTKIIQLTPWIFFVRYFQDVKTTIIVSTFWNKTIKAWNNSFMSLMHTFVGHKVNINTLDLTSNKH